MSASVFSSVFVHFTVDPSAKDFLGEEARFNLKEASGAAITHGQFDKTSPSGILKLKEKEAIVREITTAQAQACCLDMITQSGTTIAATLKKPTTLSILNKS